MHIQKATAADLPKAMQCYEEIIDKTPGIEHLAMWRKGQHPTEETILSYINKGEFYILWDHETIAGMMALANGISETYRTVNWITKATDTEAAELHVLGVSPDYQGKGIARQLIHEALCLCKENGKKVLAINLSGGDEFRYIHGRAEYKNVKSVDISEFNDYDIVVIDLGNPFYIDSNGDFCGISSGYNYKNIEILKISSLKIVMALSDAWHINKCKYFLLDEKWAEQISNSYIFLFDTEPPKQLLKYNVNMFDRNSDSFANEIARLFL
mgnify:CR=1 FL=1